MGFSHRQGVAGSTSGNPTSFSITLPSTPIQGNLICVGFAVDNGGNATPPPITGLSIKDANGNAYIISPNSPQNVYPTFTGPPIAIYAAYLIAPANASATINATWTTADDIDMFADEFTVSGGTVAFDKDVGLSSIKLAGTTVNVPSITPSNATNLLYCALVPSHVGISAPNSGATLGNWTGVALGNTPDVGSGGEYQINAIGTAAVDFTLSSADPTYGECAVVMSFTIPPVPLPNVGLFDHQKIDAQSAYLGERHEIAKFDEDLAGGSYAPASVAGAAAVTDSSVFSPAVGSSSLAGAAAVSDTGLINSTIEAITLAGSADAEDSAVDVMPVSVSLPGAAAAQTSDALTMPESISLAGAAAVTDSSVFSPAVGSSSLAGAAAVSDTGLINSTIEAITLAGSADAEDSAVDVMPVSVSLPGAATAQTSDVLTMPASISAAGSADAQASDVIRMSASVSLSGSAALTAAEGSEVSGSAACTQSSQTCAASGSESGAPIIPVQDNRGGSGLNEHSPADGGWFIDPIPLLRRESKLYLEPPPESRDVVGECAASQRANRARGAGLIVISGSGQMGQRSARTRSRGEMIDVELEAMALLLAEAA